MNHTKRLTFFQARRFGKRELGEINLPQEFTDIYLVSPVLPSSRLRIFIVAYLIREKFRLYLEAWWRDENRPKQLLHS